MALKNDLAVYWIIIMITYWDFITHVSSEEFCIHEYFEPTCNDEDILLIQNAKYGRMKIGRCVRQDLGYIGCAANVKQYLDESCSGKHSCKIPVAMLETQATRGCIEGLQKYLDVSYMCVASTRLPKHCTESTLQTISVKSTNSYISSDDIKSSCIRQSKGFKLEVPAGQTLNISILNLATSTPGIAGEIYGSATNPAANIENSFGFGPEETHILTASDSVTINLQQAAFDNAHFLLHVTVQGCANLEPPEGAWLTRDGNNIEIGCHSGAKSWTMICIDNQWTGSIGQCGANDNEITYDKEIIVSKEALSTNVAIFAACSVLILISSIVFLVGVCLLKRKQTIDKDFFVADPSILPAGNLPYRPSDSGYPTEMLVNYNSLQMQSYCNQ